MFVPEFAAWPPALRQPVTGTPAEAGFFVGL
jgi:hypothetical protein